MLNWLRQRYASRRAFIVLCLVASTLLVLLSGGSLLGTDPLVSQIYRDNLPMAILGGLLINPRPVIVSLALFGVSLLLVTIVSAITRDLAQNVEHRQWLKPLTVVGLISILILSRLLVFQTIVFPISEGATGQWVGLSYLIFRLIHVVVDSERLGAIPAGDLQAYALFPPALIAGPIHRANQFLPQLNQPHWPESIERFVECIWRIALGAVKKLVLANALALFALNPRVATNSNASRGLLGLSLIAYAFMLYFDFAGYSDIAIGVAGLFGIKLPENFANPYAQSSVARFWQTWHMSLSFWLRDYIFFPLSRTLLARFGRRWTTPIMATAHLTTMLTAGLWHGFSTGFIAWGAWHGVGLFANAQWSTWLKRHDWKLPSILGIAFTFTFVLIGWVFFALPTVESGLQFLMRFITG